MGQRRARARAVSCPVLGEQDPLGTCYTSGTTGSRRASSTPTARRCCTRSSPRCPTRSASRARHAAAGRADVPRQRVGPAVHRGDGRHALVLPGPYLDPPSLLELFAERARDRRRRRADDLDRHPRRARREPGKWKLVPGLRMIVGGSAAPEQLIRDFDRLGMRSPRVGDDRDLAHRHGVAPAPREHRDAKTQKYACARSRAVPPPLVELRVRNERGDVPRDDATSGEVLVRGPWIAGAYAAATCRSAGRRRLLPHRRRRAGRRARLRAAHRSHRRSGQVRRRVDRVRGARERAHGSPRGEGGGGDRRGSPKWSERPLRSSC